MTTVANVLQAITFSTALWLVCVLIGRFMNRLEPPAELVATISGWPPPSWLDAPPIDLERLRQAPRLIERGPWPPPLLAERKA